MLTVFSATGLRSDSCDHLRHHVMEHADSARALLSADPPDYDELADLLLDASVGVDEMTPDAEYAGDSQALLQAWLAGTPIDDLRRNFAPAAASVEDLTKFIEDSFAYRLPWGFAGYLRIAASVLSIDEVGMGAQFFPSMVKFGVPVPEAAWAMAAGVPIRRVAISLAGQFLTEIPAGGCRAFLEWLGRVEVEALQIDHGLSGGILDDVARVLHRVGRNPLLHGRQDLNALLPVTVSVQGIRYGNRRFAAHRASPGQAVALEREYDNLVDQNAIRVLVESQELGYLPRAVAQVVAPELDSGQELTATIVDVEEGPVPRISVALAISHAHSS